MYHSRFHSEIQRVNEFSITGEQHEKAISFDLEPTVAENSLRLEFAVVEERLQRLVPSDTLVNVVMNSKTLISRRLGGKVIGVKTKFQSTTGMPVEPSNSAAIKGGGNKGQIAGVVIVAIIVFVAIIALSVWFFRWESF